MLYEIYFFIFITLFIVVLTFYKFFLFLLSPIKYIFSYIKKEYYKYFKLNSIKKQILAENESNWDSNSNNNEIESKFKTFLKNIDLFHIFTEEEKKDIETNKNNLENNNKIKEENEIKETEKVKVVKIKSKIDKLFLKIEVEKQKWDIEKLEKLLIEVLSIDENNIKALNMLSNLYINLWKDKKAFPLLKKLIQLDMKNDEAIWNLSKLYLELWEIDTAYVLIQKAISINNKNHRYFVTYADILYNKWELEKAIEAIETVLKLKPNNVIYLDAIASLYEELWEYKKAKAYWLEILDLEPDYTKAKEKLQQI